MKQSIALIGPGAIGGTAAAALLDSGRHDLTICANRPFDTLTTTRSDNGETRGHPVKVLTNPRDASPADWVLLAVKSHQTASAAAWLKATVGPNTKLAILQNGVEHREHVAPYIPANTTIVPVVVMLPAERTAPGKITMYGRSILTAPDDDAGRAFAALFAGTFMRAETDADFLSRAWEKLCMNVPGGALSALCNRPDAVAAVPGVADIARALLAEAMAVGRAEGAHLDPSLADTLMGFFARPNNRGNSMYYDRRDGKPLEWDARNGVIARLGKKHGIPTPVSDVIVALLRGLSGG